MPWQGGGGGGRGVYQPLPAIIGETDHDDYCRQCYSCCCYADAPVWLLETATSIMSVLLSILQQLALHNSKTAIFVTTVMMKLNLLEYWQLQMLGRNEAASATEILTLWPS